MRCTYEFLADKFGNRDFWIWDCANAIPFITSEIALENYEADTSWMRWTCLEEITLAED